MSDASAIMASLPPATTMAMGTALVAAGLYIQNELTNIKADIEEIKTQLSTVILQVNNNKQNIEMRNAIKFLSERLASIEKSVANEKAYGGNGIHSHMFSNTNLDSEELREREQHAADDLEYKFVTRQVPIVPVPSNATNGAQFNRDDVQDDIAMLRKKAVG